jgi:hypothetical protein
VHGIDDYAVIALAGHSGINVQRGLAPIEFEQDCTAALDRYFTKRLSIKQILANNAKGFFDFGAVELLAI